MASVWSRKTKQKGVLSPPAALQEVDLGVIMQNDPQQLVGGDPKKEFAKIQQPGKGSRLRRVLELLCYKGWLKDGTKQCRASRGAEESWRTTGMWEQAAERCSELEGKALGLPEEPGTCQKATRGGEAQRVDSVTVVNTCRGVSQPRENGWNELIVGCKAGDEDVPRGGGGHGGDEMGPLVQVGASGDGERSTSPQSLGWWVEDEDGTTIPRGHGDGQDLNHLGRSGEEQRRQVWDKLQHLGEDMVSWEGRSTRELAVRLMEMILRTETRMYPMETGKQGQPVARATVGGSEEAGALVDARVDLTTTQQCPRLQYPAIYHDLPIFCGVLREVSQHPPTLPEQFGNEEIWEGPDADFLWEEDPSNLPWPVEQTDYDMVLKNRSEEQWREEFPDVWAQHSMDCGLVSGDVEVEGDPVPFQHQPPFSAYFEAVLASTLRVLLDNGVVVKQQSSSNSPLNPPTLKSDGKTWRLTLNAVALNKVTLRVGEMVNSERIRATIFATLSPESKFFSMVDLSNASFAIPLAEGSRSRFAFTFQGQQYLFTRLPQGFHSTNSILHQRVVEMLSQLPREDKPWVFSCIDDILIAGTSREETKARTRRVLELIQKTGFKAKFEKAQLVQPEVDYLGVTVGAEGRAIQARKLETIRTAPCPRNVADVRVLLGHFSCHRDHLPNYWELAHPLHHLTKKQVSWMWGEEQEQALSRLKQAVLTAPTLRFPDKSQPFLITITTGEEALGAALLQENEGGKLVPVQHSSRLLKDLKVYVPEEKGCLAAVWAVQAFETFTGPASVFIQMPHSPCRYLLRDEASGSNGTNPRPAQWSLLLVDGVEMPAWEDTSISLVHSAPRLRQLPSDVSKANVWFVASKKVSSVGFAAASLEERWLLGVAEGNSVLSGALVALWQLLCHHHCSSPLYLYTGYRSLVERLESQRGEWDRRSGARSGKGLWSKILRWVHSNPGMLRVRWVGEERSKDTKEMEWNQRVCRRARAMSNRAVGQQIWEPSKHEKQEIVARCHSGLHEEVEETLARVRRVASWEGDHNQVTRWVQNCLECAAAGREGAGKLRSQRVEGPWSQLHLGYISNLPKNQDGPSSLLVVEDEFSGWVEAFPIGKETVEEVATVLSRQVFARYGTPCTIHLPPAAFLQRVVAMVTSGVEPPWDILKSHQVESATATLQRLAKGVGKEWVKMLPVILAGIRSVRAQGEALSPYKAVGGFPLEMWWACEVGGCPQDNVLSWLCELREDGAGYRQQVKAALAGDWLEEEEEEEEEDGPP